MSINQELGNTRRQIIPSARRSIHSDDRRAVPGGSADMVRYGEDSSDEERTGGVDEVDNVMSKFSHTSSPVAMRRRNSMTPPNLRYTDDSDEHKISHTSSPVAMRRRNSMTPPNLRYTDDSDEHGELAKSLPAKLPSAARSYYSNDDWRAHSSKQHNNSDSVSPHRFVNRSAETSNSSFTSRSPNVSHRINRSSREREQSTSSNIIMYLFGLLAVLCATYYYDLFSSLVGKARYDEVRFRSDLDELGAKYKIGDDSILQLQAGISTIFEREDTSCVIFLYNSQKKGYDASKFDGFVNNVVTNAAKFLRNETTPSAHRVVDAADLPVGTHTQLVRAYQHDIAAAGVLLVTDVAQLPSPLAMALHYYCDEYQPLVRKSAIFFTLNTATCHNSGEILSSHASAEKCLKEKWNTVPKDNIGPLLTRVANIVVDLTSGV